MSNENVHRQTIRIKRKTKERIKALVKLGEYITEAEVIRTALEVGLNELESRH